MSSPNDAVCFSGHPPALQKREHTITPSRVSRAEGGVAFSMFTLTNQKADSAGPINSTSRDKTKAQSRKNWPALFNRSAEYQKLFVEFEFYCMN